MKQITHPEIPGWGADKEPSKRPAYPKEKTPPHGTGAHWKEPEQQIPSVEIFRSIERPGLTPVFGTSCPPRGLSGLIRKYAYQFGEARLAHWMTLLLADRVNVVEGIFEDLANGRMPMLLTNGWLVDLKHDRKLFAKRAVRAAMIAGGTAALVYWLAGRRSARRLGTRHA